MRLLDDREQDPGRAINGGIAPLDLRRLDDAPGSPEEKAAEIEAALEYEIKVGGGEKNPVTRGDTQAAAIQNRRAPTAIAEHNVLRVD